MSKVKDWKGMSNDTGVIRMNEVDQFTWYPFSLANGSTKKISPKNIPNSKKAAAVDPKQ
jgi:hypothetical protein